MSNMVLGTYTFAEDPADTDDLIKSVNHSSHLKTYSSVQRFNWGASIVGKLVTLQWGAMPAAQYDSIHTKWLAGAPITWDPKLTSGATFTVTIENMTGKYFITQEDVDMAGAPAYRVDCALTLLITAVI